MDKFLVKGQARLKGDVPISGSKNASLPILIASLLTRETCVIRNIPDLMDVQTTIKLLKSLGKSVKREGEMVIIEENGSALGTDVPYELVKTMRASICALGPLLTRFGHTKISYPGGCALGPRPIDLHLKGMEDLGAKINLEHGDIVATAKRLKGKKIYLSGTFGPTVLGTENVMMAACLAEGQTIIESAAREPEVGDLACVLKKMGAKISGLGTSILTIEGVKELSGVDYTVMPDRIEVGTFLAMAAITKSSIDLHPVAEDHIENITRIFLEMGCQIDIKEGWLKFKPSKSLFPMTIETRPYPNFPTDMQPQMMALFATIENELSVITERIYPDRFIHVGEFQRMGANIKMENPSAIIRGVKKLTGAQVMASDLRGGAALVTAALAAEGESVVNRVYHIDRGYDRLEAKLSAVGASIQRVN